MLTTAYCVHTSEGIPVRRIMETKTNGTTIAVNVTECDWDWNKKQKVQTFEFLVRFQPWWIRADSAQWILRQEELYHERFRQRMNHQHNWRFEVYWPLSSLVK